MALTSQLLALQRSARLLTVSLRISSKNLSESHRCSLQRRCCFAAAVTSSLVVSTARLTWSAVSLISAAPLEMGLSGPFSSFLWYSM